MTIMEISACMFVLYYLCDVDDDVARGINDEKEVIDVCQGVSPRRPMLDVFIPKHL